MTKVDVLLGLQWGDEGKGKIVDVLSGNYDIIARFQGGPNAGHTLEFDGKKHVLHQIPSGIFHPKTINLIGNGVIIDANILRKELDALIARGAKPSENLLISKKAHLIIPTHRMLDAAYENSKGDKKIGSTLKGIGPTYTDKIARVGLRIGDTMDSSFEDKYQSLKDSHLRLLEAYNFDYRTASIDGISLEEYEKLWLTAIESIKKEITFVDSEQFINKQLAENKRVLAEGAQGSLLDIDFGSYPFVTSSNTTTAAVCTGLGISPAKVGKVFGVFKAYCTRVGSGPFPSELENAVGQKLRDNGHEYGSTTGRPRRCGWIDIPALNYAIMLDGVSDLIITKADVMDNFDELMACTSYKIDGVEIDYMPFEIATKEIIPQLTRVKGWHSDISNIKNYAELPKDFINYLNYIESLTNLPISIISTGPDRKQTIIR
ncbi:MAG: adenylosuccinate synthase [Bacteroidetes bacterium CG2_30_33_31]|nr:MAG: adenylosuccinate synthase [Bacteroidetes bacterium CG2_30_33_31]